MGFMMGFAVGMAAGVMFGTFSFGKMMQSGGTFGTFMSIGMDICCRDHLYGTYL
uniref:Reactive oxygen species modulator 1 n=1 Tax=Salmo trutta TaxID=8032 RepID=A0A674DJF9_SALTR